MKEKKVLWNDRKRTIFGLPWSFTKYKLTEEKFIIQTGFFSIKQEEVNAEFKNGILKICIPKKEERKELPEAKHIEIK